MKMNFTHSGLYLFDINVQPTSQWLSAETDFFGANMQFNLGEYTFIKTTNISFYHMTLYFYDTKIN